MVATYTACGDHAASPLYTQVTSNTKSSVLLRQKIRVLEGELAHARRGGGGQESGTYASGPARKKEHVLSSSNTIAVNTDLETAFDAYIKLCQDMAAGKTKKRFVIAAPSGQMNNRVRVLVSILVFGLLTNRMAVINFDKGYYAKLSDLFDTPYDMDANQVSGLRGARSLEDSDVDTFLCQDFNRMFADDDAVQFNTPPSLVPFFFRNPHHQPTLKGWFGGEEFIYRDIVRRFLRPTREVAEMRDAWLHKHQQTAAHRPYMLGIHLRMGTDLRPSPNQEEWEHLLECAVKVVPQQHKATAIWYVAADTQETRDKALSTFSGDGKVVFYGDKWLRSNNPAGVKSALVELLLLAEADNRLLTPASSYGEQAMAIAGKPSYYIKSTVPRPPKIAYKALHPVTSHCFRTFTSQPSITGFSQQIEKARCYHPDMAVLSF
eukprot:CAMPEP_0175120590 /NCGR_PEP_ID=MMETSP0087-20121206/705_1 /TAXON_ID=136419 /ORGANISM="Unknown Unknown, Strain D1" /LENGTH=433 /DNA_ID=CAMNT_0016402053 /DNA_START=63 /DNA_END=1364 /DNA_ORIENTATION=+